MGAEWEAVSSPFLPFSVDLLSVPGWLHTDSCCQQVEYVESHHWPEAHFGEHLLHEVHHSLWHVLLGTQKWFFLVRCWVQKVPCSVQVPLELLCWALEVQNLVPEVHDDHGVGGPSSPLPPPVPHLEYADLKLVLILSQLYIFK